MSEDFQEKTERATPRKKDKAREKGQIARNKDLTSMLTMSGTVFIFYFGGEYFFRGLADMTGGVLSLRYGMEAENVTRIALLSAMKFLVPLLLLSLFLAIGSSIAQGGMVLKPMKIEIEKLNPVNGLKNLVSVKGMIELLKSMLKFAVGGWIVYDIVAKDLRVLPDLTAMDIRSITKFGGSLIMDAVIVAFAFYMIVAVVSYLLERYQYERSLKMTKQEIKDEGKEAEGDPLIKSRIRTAQREAARKRMMQEVPNATVIITNPTHLAIAIRYDEDMPAPRIVAKGAGFVAEKIRKIARENSVPIVEDKPLARALFKHELNSFVPERLYMAVARILAYIYRLKGSV